MPDVVYTKQELEARMSDDELYRSMQRRMDSMKMAANRFREWGKNRNAGIWGALMDALYEIDERMRYAHILGLRYEPKGDGSPQADSHCRIAALHEAQLNAHYPVIRRMYDAFADSRLLEPSEVTEATREGDARERARRDRDNPVLVYAHDSDCTIDHIANGPKGRRKNCPTPEEWDE